MVYLKVAVITAVILGIQGHVANHPHKGKYLRDYTKKWSSSYLPNRYIVGVNTPCGKAIKEFNHAMSIQSKEAWALTMVDSWGKSNDGFAYGVPYILGAYDQCLRIASTNNNIRGKYCRIFKNTEPVLENSIDQKSPVQWVGDGLQWSNPEGQSIDQPIQWRGQSMDQLRKEISFDFFQRDSQQSGLNRASMRKKNYNVNILEDHQSNSSVRMGGIPFIHPYGFLIYGTCMPHVCTKDQLQASVAVSNIQTPGTPWVINCDDPDPEISLDAVDISFISFCSLLGILMLAGTAVHGYILFTKQEHLTKGPLKFILPFAVSLNLKKIFNINSRPAPGTISCLNGMRVMSMCWVIWGHQNLFTLWALSNQNGLYLLDGVLSQIITNAALSVDSFFYMSGLLVCYGVFREMSKTGSLNIIMYYVHRIIRLTPPIAVSVWYFSTLNRFTVDEGPIPFSFSSHTNDTANMCREYGWRDIAYVSNVAFRNNETWHGCMGQCWYTAVDTQLYALGPLVLLPLYYFKTVGFAWLYLVTLASVGMRGFLTWNGRNKDEGGNPWMYDTYFPTWARADAWLIGIWTGYFIANMGKKKLELKQWQVVVGWTLAVVFGLIVQFGRYHAPEYIYGTWDITYEMIHRTIWASCLAWVTIACHYGYGGIVNDFLSHPSWQPFSRLTYTTYLVANQFTLSLTNASRTLFYYTHINKIIETCGILFISTLFALLVSLSVEAPILGLEKLLLKRPGRSNQEAVDNKASAPPIPDNQVSVPISGKSLPPGYMRHAETFSVSESGKNYPATGYENSAFERSEQEDTPLNNMSGKHIEAGSTQLEQNQQPPANDWQAPTEVEVIVLDSKSSN